jgi:hypothetical protein
MCPRVQVLIELLGPEVCTLDEEGQRTAQLTMDEMKILWHRSEENRKARPSPLNNHQQNSCRLKPFTIHTHQPHIAGS